jgi:hypothetical protein
MLEITLKDKKYDIDDTLEVAYEMQTDFDKPYTEVFAGMKRSYLQDQIKVIYTAFRILNPGVFTYEQFFKLVLKEWNLNVILDKVNTIMANITGPAPASTAGEEKKV